MRRIYVVAFSLILFGILIPSTSEAVLGIGFKAGLNFADLNQVEKLDTLEKIENETKHGFIAGASLTLPVSPTFKLQVEGLYSVKGSSGSAIDGLDIQKWENKLTYLEIPVLLKAEFPTPLVKPFIYGGASVGILLGAEERIRADWFDIKDSLNSHDLGLVVGGGAKLLGFTVEGRYTHGLSDSVDSPDPRSLVTQSRNKTYSVMVGLDLF